MSSAAPIRVGVLADTHGVLCTEVIQLFNDTHVAGILHAGDGLSADIRHALTRIAPLVEVRGNMDSVGNFTAVAQFGGLIAYVLHRLEDLDIDPVAAGIMAVITGHTHVPSVHWKEGVLYLNPGSPSFPRHGSAASVALLSLDDTGCLSPTIHTIGPLQRSGVSLG
jgi:uncharacterized protein